ncbi:MAG: S-methyl-5-thioribose-1-phosphate isomerase [Thermoplasmata archaeon]|nr:S-methyl-5-thioribose-1-phosphate isomerase [Thermoplasmata archaeon]
MKVKIEGKPRDLRSVWLEDDIVKFIDQRSLPGKLEFYEARDISEVAYSIKNMVVRGAPAIGAAAAYGMLLAHLQNGDMEGAADALRRTRPTAHDLFFAVNHMLSGLKKGTANARKLAEDFVDAIVDECRNIGVQGEKLISDNSRILTHCNAGALATVDYGTALAPIRAANDSGKKPFVFVDETRPLLQGSRLTSWELSQEGIEHRIIADNAAGHFMAKGEIDLVIVGADRIALNGDAANKIGTYEKAVLAKENGIPFYVAAPKTTFDPKTETGKEIDIEERDEAEVLEYFSKGIAPDGARARNPAFDVTPNRYITGIITDKGILKPSEVKERMHV